MSASFFTNAALHRRLLRVLLILEKCPLGALTTPSPEALHVYFTIHIVFAEQSQIGEDSYVHRLLVVPTFQSVASCLNGVVPV